MANKGRSLSARFVRLYQNEAKQWGEHYMMRNYWRIRSMMDYDDIKQAVFFIFLRTCRKYPNKPNTEIMKIFKAGVVGHTHNRARQCFPNSHALKEGVGQIVVPLEDWLPEVTSPNEYLSCVEYFSDWLAKLPKELSDALLLLIEDFTGVSCIEQRRTKKLSGKERLEPFRVALARKANLGLSRDVIQELANEMNITLVTEEQKR